MALSDKATAYEQEYDYLDDALSRPKGIRIPCEKEGDANHLRLRLHKARQLERVLSEQLHARGSADWGKTKYDGLAVRMKTGVDGTHFIYIEKKTIGEVEDLSEVEE